jgi:hypothetical protein
MDSAYVSPRSSRGWWQGFDSLRSPYGLPAAVYLRSGSQPAQPNLPCALPPLTPESPAAVREYLFTAGSRLRHIRRIGRSHFV